MDIIFITVPVTLLFIASGVAIFFWANKGGQFDDLDSPAHRILFDDDIEQSNNADDAQEEKAETKDSNP
ncbi:MAG: cbb3-type cytochrome oxidase assembly protein CcoS [Gammaproteobacteria bacterium]|nr:cbb3-type cytochrome oxidase assembly protein CcoS [Gammaproteobacteria bacterium]